MHAVDLTHVIKENMPVYPGTEGPKMVAANSYQESGFRETCLTFYSHTGTHMDAPAHLYPTGKTLDVLPITQFSGTAVVIHCPELQAGERIAMRHIRKQWETANQAEFILFHTGWSRYWGQPEYFGDYPYITHQVADWLLKTGKKGIGLDTIGVQMDRRGFVEIDGLCRTNVPGVCAIGDINGKMQLAHVATAQGTLVADHIAGKPCKQLNYNRIPSCVYCNPETAMVGLTEEQARATGKDVGTGVFNLSGNGKALTMGENHGFVKFVFDKATEEILGFHVIGPRATDLAAEVAAVMECEGTISEIGSTVHPHPTVSEAVMEAAHACHGNSVHAPKARK